MIKIFFISLLFLYPLCADDIDNSFDEFQSEFKDVKSDSSQDPLRFYNEPMTKFNDFAYMYVMGPITKGYRYVVPTPARNGISNFFDNLKFPIRFINNILQLKFKNAIEESVRFVINSTYGLGGFMKIAQRDGGIKEHNEDFGQTLGYYGVGDKFYIVLPLLGPSNVRDIFGMVADTFIDPLHYAKKDNWVSFRSKDRYLYVDVAKSINEYSFYINQYESIRNNSIDLYSLLKKGYTQRRAKLIEE